MKFASIDIGSNSILLHIAKKEGSKLLPLEDQARIAGLGRGIDQDQKFLPESMVTAFEILSEYKLILESHGVEAKNLFITATEASRAVTNAHELFDRVKNKLGFEIEIISGEQEATYAALGATSGVSLESGILLDIGGASTEVIKFTTDPFTLEEVISLPIGSVRATDWLKKNEFESNLDKVFAESLDRFRGKELVAIAGTVTSLAAMMKGLSQYDDKIVDNSTYSLEQILSFNKTLLNLSEAQINKEFSFLGKRSSVIIGGARVFEEFLRRLNVGHVQVSTKGLRHGVLIDRVLKI